MYVCMYVLVCSVRVALGSLAVPVIVVFVVVPG